MTIPLALLHFVFVFVLTISPWFVFKREFGGAGLLAGPLGWVNPQQLSLPEGLNASWILAFFVVWVVLAVLAALVGSGRLGRSPQQRARWLYLLGGLGILVVMLEWIAFAQTLAAINGPAIAQGVAAGRLPLRRASLSLGVYAAGLYSLLLLLLGRMQLPGGKAFLVRQRAVVVPLVSLGLAVVAGAVVVWVLRPGLGADGVALSWHEAMATKLDLVTYTFQLLFSPLTNLAGLFQSLLLATPLIFTGLAVAFGFHGGLFNIGAPGQLTMGAIATMLVGVYLPGPQWLVLPLAVLAAAAGGGLWGAFPGWLKARFGTHEVINTIMLNYIAASTFLFLISANEYSFFGLPFSLPFKAPGLAASSYEIRPEARLPRFLSLLGLEGSGQGSLSWALPLALLAGVGAYLLLRQVGRRLAAALGAVALGYIVGGILPGMSIEVSPALASVRLNGSFLIALFAVVAVNVYLWRTQGGYELRAMGLAPRAAEYAGVNLARKLVLTMAISGALAGLAATHYVLGAGIDEYRLKQSLPASVGFDGIAVALMGQNHPIGIALTSLLFGVLLTGGLQLNLELGISRELVTTLQALIVLFIAAGGFLPIYFRDPLRAAQVEMEAADPERKPQEVV